MKADFKCWFPDDGDTEAEAIDVLQAYDEEVAAQEALEYRVCNDGDHHIDGDPVKVVVRREGSDRTRTFMVRASASVDYFAEKV